MTRAGTPPEDAREYLQVHAGAYGDLSAEARHEVTVRSETGIKERIAADGLVPWDGSPDPLSRTFTAQQLWGSHYAELYPDIDRIPYNTWVCISRIYAVSRKPYPSNPHVHELISRVDGRRNSDIDVQIAAQRLAMHTDPSYLPEIMDSIHRVTPGRIATGGFSAPKALLVVSDAGMAVLAGVTWSGFMPAEIDKRDSLGTWDEVLHLAIWIPGNLRVVMWGVTGADKLGLHDGKERLSIVIAGQGTIHFVPEETMSFYAAARSAAHLLRQSELGA